MTYAKSKLFLVFLPGLFLTWKSDSSPKTVYFASWAHLESKQFLSKKNVLDKVQLINCDLIATPEYPKADIAIGLGLFDYISDQEVVIKKAHLSSNFVVASWVRPSIRNYLRRFRYSCELYTHTEKEVSQFFNNIGISSVSFIECGPMCGFISISSRN